MNARHLAVAKAAELFKNSTPAWIAAVFLSFLPGIGEARSQTPAPPDIVKLPSGLDLGGSSFYDGFGRTDTGWVYINYARWNDLTSIRDNNGRKSPLFVDPQIDVFSNLFHIIYISPVGGPNGTLTFEALLPVIGFDSRFDPRGLSLHDNGWNIGDLTVGTDYQSNPITFNDTSVFSWRAGLDFVAPTGGFDGTRDLNQSAGFWSITPYFAATVLPVPKWEMSIRFSYDYNFSTNRGSDAPAIPGFAFRDGQAGQAGWINFASSYEMFDGVRPGINGYWLHQLTDDRTNGLSVPSARVDELYLGPGLSWQADQQNVVNFNIYLPVFAANAPAGPQFNIQEIVRF